jgi:hypothetical protein
MEKYYIDFDRVNELTTTIYDDPLYEGPLQKGNFAYSISRKFILNYLSIFTERRSKRVNSELVQEAIEQLEFNKILISESTLRDNKINIIINEN